MAKNPILEKMRAEEAENPDAPEDPNMLAVEDTGVHPAVQSMPEESAPAPADKKAEKETPIGKFFSDEELVTVRVGGRQYTLPKDAALAYQDELTRPRETVQAPAPNPVPESNSQGVAVDLFTDPEKTLADREAALEERILQKAEAKYSGDRAEERFWSTFYGSDGAGKDLSEYKDVVDFVTQSNLADLSKLGLAEADLAEELAKRSRSFILKTRKGTRESGSPTRESTTLEGSSSVSEEAKAKKEEDPDAPVSLSSALKARRAERVA